MNNPFSGAARTITVNSERAYDTKLDRILSSARPYKEGTSYTAHQKLALASQLKVAKTVVLFNLPEEVDNPQQPGLVLVGPNQNPPTIRQLLEYLAVANDDEVVAIVNSDIILTKDFAKITEAAARASLGRAWACTSFRQCYIPETGELLPPTDYGLDIFCSTVRIWRDVAKAIPGVLTIGKPLWDNWLNSFLHTYIDRNKYFDITDWKCVLHAPHDDRNHSISTEEQPLFSAAAQTITHPGGLPTRKLPLPR